MRNLIPLLLLLMIIGCNAEDVISANIEFQFEPITVTGKIDWDFSSPRWQYRQDGITYLKQVTLEFESDEGRFGRNRVILVNLSKDTVRRDADFTEYVDFLGTESIRLTYHIGIATYIGEIVGAPTKD